AFDVPVDAVAVRPVALDRDEREPLLRDQPLADPSSPVVVLVRAVRRLAEQDAAGLADPLKERVEVGGSPPRPRQVIDGGDQILAHGRILMAQSAATHHGQSLLPKPLSEPARSERSERSKREGQSPLPLTPLTPFAACAALTRRTA